MEDKVNIFGSCVTRDVFSSTENNQMVVKYIARQSLHSLVSVPITQALESEFPLPNNWKEKMVYNDLFKINKELFSNKILIVDLIDERHKIIKIGNSIITETKELLVSNILNKVGEFKNINRGTGFDFDEWDKTCRKFKNIILKNNIQVVFHETYWAQFNENNEPLSNMEFINNNNERLKRYNKIFKDIIEPQFSFCVNESYRKSALVERVH